MFILNLASPENITPNISTCGLSAIAGQIYGGTTSESPLKIVPNLLDGFM